MCKNKNSIEKKLNNDRQLTETKYKLINLMNYQKLKKKNIERKKLIIYDEKIPKCKKNN